MKKFAYYFVKYNVLLIVLFLIDKFIVKVDGLSMVRAVGIVIVIALYDIIMNSTRKYRKLKKANS